MCLKCLSSDSKFNWARIPVSFILPLWVEEELFSSCLLYLCISQSGNLLRYQSVRRFIPKCIHKPIREPVRIPVCVPAYFQVHSYFRRFCRVVVISFNSQEPITMIILDIKITLSCFYILFTYYNTLSSNSIWTTTVEEPPSGYAVVKSVIFTVFILSVQVSEVSRSFSVMPSPRSLLLLFSYQTPVRP